MALNQTEAVEPCCRLELGQEAEAGLLLGDHGEASCCFSEASLPGHCGEGPSGENVLDGGEDSEMGLLGHPELTQGD